MATFNALRDQIVAYLRNGFLMTDNPYREFDVGRVGAVPLGA